MGYETYHELEVFEIDKLLDNDNALKYLPVITEEQANLISELILGEEGYIFDSWEKWGDRVQDMIDYSTKYPDLIFCITGAGEDREDNWKEWYKNGKMYICQGTIEYDDFDIKDIL